MGQKDNVGSTNLVVLWIHESQNHVVGLHMFSIRHELQILPEIGARAIFALLLASISGRTH
jgi:hypothetical protein